MIGKLFHNFVNQNFIFLDTNLFLAIGQPIHFQHNKPESSKIIDYITL